MKIRQFYFPFLIGFICFLYLLGRAAWVPISHDEAATYFHYIQPGTFIPYYAHWDANNHFLNSALAYLFGSVFGNDLFWFRLPNVLAFVLYAYYGWKILFEIKDNLIRNLAYVALLTAWLPLEFFAQLRGYGLSLGLLMGSLVYLYAFAREAKPRNLIFSLVFIIAACLANASLSNSFLLILAMQLLLIIRSHISRKFNIAAYVFFGLIPYFLLAKYAFDMKERGLLYYGSTDGFIDVTVRTLSKYTFDIEAGPFLVILVLIGLASSTVLLFKKDYLNLDAGKIFAVLLLGNAAGVILLELLFEVNFPEDRTGIYFIPFFIICFAFALGSLKSAKYQIRYLSLALAAFPAISISNANFKEVKLWESLPISEEIFKKIEDSKLGNLERPLIVEGYKLYMLSWGYHNVKSDGRLAPLATRQFSSNCADFQICYADECNPYQAEFMPVWENYPGGIALLKRKTPVLFESTYKEVSDSSKTESGLYAGIIVTDSEEQIKELKAIEYSAVLDIPEESTSIQVVVAARDESDQNIYYDYFSLRWIRNEWKNDSLNFIRPVNLPAHASKLVCYFYNPDQSTFEIKSSEVKLLTISNTKESPQTGVKK